MEREGEGEEGSKRESNVCLFLYLGSQEKVQESDARV